eukprot:1076155-Rhodomonas_salina.6
MYPGTAGIPGIVCTQPRPEQSAIGAVAGIGAAEPQPAVKLGVSYSVWVRAALLPPWLIVFRSTSALVPSKIPVSSPSACLRWFTAWSSWLLCTCSKSCVLAGLTAFFAPGSPCDASCSRLAMSMVRVESPVHSKLTAALLLSD